MQSPSSPRGPVFDIRDSSADQHYYHRVSEVIDTLTSTTLTIQNVPVELRFGTIVYAPRIRTIDGMDTAGRRTFFGITAVVGRNSQLLQLVQGPSEYAVGNNTYEYRGQLRHERQILGLLASASMDSCVTPLPRAFQTESRIYESTAPGIRLNDAVLTIAGAFRNGELSRQEVSMLLTKMRASASESLSGLHNKGLKHYHPHANNFNVNLQTGSSMVFDYTIAVAAGHPDTVVQTDHRELTADDFAEDFDQFETAWNELLKETGLDEVATDQHLDTSAMDAAVSKLEPAVIRRALRRLDVPSPSEQDIENVILAQRELIDAAPDIYYPKDTLGQRSAHRLAKARALLKDIVANW